MSQSVIITFIGACVGLLVMVLGAFIKLWLESLQGTMSKLSASIDRLAGVAISAEKRLDGHDRDLEDHGAAILHLHRIRCAGPDCPHRHDDGPDTNPFLLRGMPRDE